MTARFSRFGRHCLTCCKIVIHLSLWAVCFLIIIGIPLQASAEISPQPGCQCNRQECTCKSKVDGGSCDPYLEKLKSARDSCETESIIILDEIANTQQCACLIREVSRVKGEYYDYYGRCIGDKLDISFQNCQLELIINEEKLVNSKLKNWSGFPSIQGLVLYYKCFCFAELCIQDMIDKAISEDNWKLIIYLEDILSDNSLANCPNYENLSDMVLDAKRDYFQAWVLDKLADAIHSYDLMEISRLEELLTKSMKNASGFHTMHKEFSELKCQHMNDLLDYLLNEAMTYCNEQQLQEVAGIFQYRWRRDCAGYDYRAMTDKIARTKLTYLGNCSNDNLRTFSDNCDVGRILELEMMAQSLPDAENLLKKIQMEKCLTFAKCFQADLDIAITNGNEQRLKELQQIINSGSFDGCSSAVRLKNILLQQKNISFE